MSAGAFPRGAYTVLAVVSNGYSVLLGRFLRVTHPSATFHRSKLRPSFDLHVLGMPPAFVLSQDQTLKFNFASCSAEAEPLQAAWKLIS